MTIRSRWPLYMLSMLAANLIGAVLVFAFVRYGVPIQESDAIVADRVRNFAIFGVYLAFAGAVSLTAAAMMLKSVIRWRLRGGPPTRSEQMAALHAPLRQAIVHLVLWILGGIIFVFLTITEMPGLAIAVIVTVCMAATTTFGFTYMLGERILRPVAAQALSEGEFDRTMAPGVGTRLAMTWGLGTLMPVAGIILLCSTQLTTNLEVLPRLARVGDPAHLDHGDRAGLCTVDADGYSDLRSDPTTATRHRASAARRHGRTRRGVRRQ